MHIIRSFSIVGAVLVLSVAVATASRAQMIGVPVLQNAFTNRGLTAGVDFGAATDVRTYGAAVAWSPTTEKYQLSAGVAYLDQTNASGTATYGARFMVPVLGHSAPLGLAPFVGVGGARVSGVTEWRIPLGISAGYRRALGTSGRGISAYVSPFYTWARVRANDVTTTHGLFRVSFGIDAAVLPSVGVTAGFETGATAGEGQPGATGGIFGLGVSYAFHHAQQKTKATPAAAETTP